MRFGKLSLAAAAACGLAASSASAAITAFWVPVASGNGSVGSMYPAGALPDLTNFQTWDLRVTTDGNWASAGLRATLPAGNNFYQNAAGGNTKPNSAFFPVIPALEFTTYVSAPGDNGVTGAPSVLGGFPEGQNDPSLGSATSVIPGTFSMSWGDLVNDAPGTYQIARLTFPLGMVPDVLTEPPNPSNTSQVTPDSTTNIPKIPEPGALGLVAAAGLFALRRRT